MFVPIFLFVFTVDNLLIINGLRLKLLKFAVSLRPCKDTKYINNY